MHLWPPCVAWKAPCCPALFPTDGSPATLNVCSVWSVKSYTSFLYVFITTVGQRSMLCGHLLFVVGTSCLCLGSGLCLRGPGR